VGVLVACVVSNVQDVSKIAPGAISSNAKKGEKAREDKEDKARNEALDRGEPTQLAHGAFCSFSLLQSCCLCLTRRLNSQKSQDEARPKAPQKVFMIQTCYYVSLMYVSFSSTAKSQLSRVKCRGSKS